MGGTGVVVGVTRSAPKNGSKSRILQKKCADLKKRSLHIREGSPSLDCRIGRPKRQHPHNGQAVRVSFSNAPRGALSKEMIAMSYTEGNAAEAAAEEFSIASGDWEDHSPSFDELHWQKGQTMKIPVVEGQSLKSGVPVWVGSMELKYLLALYEVPYRDSIKGTGYQRKPQNARITKFAEKLVRHSVDVPTSILLNVRDVDQQNDIITGSGPVRLLEIDEETSKLRLYAVDGQHRILAAAKAIQLAQTEEEKERLLNGKLQFVLMVGAPEGEELSQFYVVNTEAKSVRTDLAYDLLSTRAQKDKAVLDELIQTGERWKVEGQEIAKRLNTEGVWRGRIRLANAEKEDTVMPVASFITSLKPMLSTPFFRQLDIDNRVQVLEAFWRGVQQAMPEPFHEPEVYVLQKGVGVSVMHMIAVDVLELIRSNGDSVVNASSYAEILGPVFDALEGETAEGEIVRGYDFWRGQKHGGAAGTYSSSAGKRVLTAKIRSLLPKMSLL